MSQSLNPYSYVMNNPQTLTDPSGYSWLSKFFHAIGHFFETYWRVIVAVVVAIVAWEVLGPYLSGLLTPAGATAAGTVTVASTAVIGDTTIAISASVAYGGGVTLIGGAVTSAIAGAISGGILGGWQGTLNGAISGALFGAVSGYYGSAFGAQRVAVTAAAGGT
jgi:hypothetical protein